MVEQPSRRDQVTRRGIGQGGERWARKYLEGAGLTILDANWRSPEGEIDIVALDGDIVVFIEVKTRRSTRFGTPEESVTRQKRTRLQRTALAYLQAHQRLDSPWRIDVIAVRGDPQRSPSVEHLVDVVEADDGFWS
jgi:putative endonuclease